MRIARLALTGLGNAVRDNLCAGVRQGALPHLQDAGVLSSTCNNPEPADYEIDPLDDADTILARIRAATPWPGASLDGRKILSAAVVHENALSVRHTSAVVLRCRNASILFHGVPS